MIKSILLLNPPSNRLILRDMYSSTYSKGDYYWPPADLLIISGILDKDFSVNILDANVLKKEANDTYNEIIQKKYDCIIFTIGVSSLNEDLYFMERLKHFNSRQMVLGTGGIFINDSINQMKSNPFIDGIILDFTSLELIRFLKGDRSDIKDIVYKNNGDIIQSPRSLSKVFNLPSVPRHDLLPIRHYNLLHARRYPVTSVLSSYGCPYSCDFCVSSTVPHKIRDIDNILEELKFISQLKIKEVIFRDNTFGANREHALNLCNEMISQGINISWVCDSRIDCLDEELIQLMKQAGCHMIHFGIESSNDKILKKYHKGINRDKVIETISYCKKYKISTMGYFIIGLPGETESDILNTINFAKDLNLDLASFNVAIPIHGTKLRDTAINNNWVKSENNYDGSYFPSISNNLLTPQRIWELRNYAFRSFYFRPLFLLKKIISIKTFYEFKNFIKYGISFLLKINPDLA